MPDRHDRPQRRLCLLDHTSNDRRRRVPLEQLGSAPTGVERRKQKCHRNPVDDLKLQSADEARQFVAPLEVRNFGAGDVSKDVGHIPLAKPHALPVLPQSIGQLRWRLQRSSVFHTSTVAVHA